MTKPVCCLLLALGLAACTAPKAIVLDEPATTGPRSKPANKSATHSTPAEGSPAPLVIQQGGMRLPEDRLLQLPDKKDMTATAPVGPGGGSGVIATPPTADKRGE